MKRKFSKFRTLLILVAAGGVLVTALAIWTAIWAFNSASQMIQTAGQSWDGIPKVLSDRCLKQSQSMMNWMTWLDRPLTENLGVLKDACAEAPPAKEVSI